MMAIDSQTPILVGAGQVTSRWDGSNELVKKCHAAQVPAQPVRDIGDVMQYPHLAATGFFSRQERLTEGSYFAMAHPVRFSIPLDTASRFAPHLGEHSGAIRASALSKTGKA